MKIQVLGTGCKKCKSLYELVRKSAQDLNIDAPIEYSVDVVEIARRGLMQSPIVLIDDTQVFAGIVPTEESIKKMLLLWKH